MAGLTQALTVAASGIMILMFCTMVLGQVRLGLGPTTPRLSQILPVD